jgi:hypothetical protein
MDETPRQVDALLATIRDLLTTNPTRWIPVFSHAVNEGNITLRHPFLSCVSAGQRITIAPTDGKRTIANAADVFTGHLSRDFQNWDTSVSSRATSATDVVVYEMTNNASFPQMFSNPVKMWLTQDQIIEFVENHRSWLGTNGCGAFFLFLTNGRFFVASVYLLSSGRPGANVYLFDDDCLWDSRQGNRIVFPSI